MRYRKAAFFVILSGVLILSGCARKTESTNQESETAVLESTAEEKDTDQIDSAHMEELLKQLTIENHPSGSEQETAIAGYIKEYFSELGYEAFIEPFTQEQTNPVSGSNVIGIRHAKQNPDQADILIISAHHDAKPGIQGAGDDASGVAVMMEAARVLKDLDSDTEVRFISFAGEEDGRIGSRFYVEQMTEEERSRVIGDIQIDEVGYHNSDYLKLGTVDGNTTLLGDMLSERAARTPGMDKPIPYTKDALSDHHSFAGHGIPAVLLQQDAYAFENHSTRDTREILDMDKLAQAARIVADVAADIMSPETPSYLEASYAQNPAKAGILVEKETPLYFSQERMFVENMLAWSGELVNSGTNEFGDTVEQYRYPVRWLGMDQPIDSLFEYRNGFLETVEIRFQEAGGMTVEEIKALVSAEAGEPDVYETDLGDNYGWGELWYHKYFSLEQEEDGYHLMVMDYSLGKEMYTTYDLSKALEEGQIPDGNDGKLLKLLDKIVYPEDRPITCFTPYTDGTGNSTGFTGGIGEDDNTIMELSLDVADAFDEQGEWKNFNKTAATAVHEYGHVISLNSGQVDLTRQDTSMPKLMFQQETYAEDAYLRAFYEAFWNGQDVKSALEYYQEHPSDFVSSYGATNISEDFADTFMLFVLSGKPEDDSVASQKIRFFYDYDELTARRDYIREQLEL